MPIYCLNSTKYARKRSKNIIHELIGSNNYYMSNSQQLSMASYHILMSKQCKSVSSSSLMVAINRFKNAVSNMKQTVLVPTMLDLVSYHEEEETDSACSSDHCSENGDRPKSACCIGFGSAEPSLCNTLQQHSNSTSDESGSAMAVSLSQHNLYEQYKLLDMIDKILSSDIALVSVQRQCHNSAIVLNMLESDDNNNCNNGKHTNCCCQAKGLEEIGRINEPHNGDAEFHARKLTNGKPSLVGKMRHNSLAMDGSQNGGGGSAEAVNGSVDDSTSDNLVVGCSLLKIKEKLEYHLISLKSILNLMSNTADCITHKYLEDIQCEDRFEPAKSCDQGESIRHYYTGN